MNQIGEVWVGHGLDWDKRVGSACFECAERIFAAIGITPDRLAAEAPGVGRNYGDYS